MAGGSLAGKSEANHGLVRPGQTKLFAGQPLDGLGVGLEGIYLESKSAAGDFLLLDLLVQPDDLLAHHLVLVHKREVRNAHQTKAAITDNNAATWVSLSQILVLTFISLVGEMPKHELKAGILATAKAGHQPKNKETCSRNGADQTSALSKSDSMLFLAKSAG